MKDKIEIPEGPSRKFEVVDVEILRNTNTSLSDDDEDDNDEMVERGMSKRSGIMYTRLGKEKFEAKQYELAVWYFRKSIESGSMNYINYFCKSQAEYTLNNLEDSCKDARKAIEYSPPGPNEIAYKCHLWLLEVKLSMAALKFCDKLIKLINRQYKMFARDDPKFKNIHSQFKKLSNCMSLIRQTQSQQQIIELSTNALKYSLKSPYLHLTRARACIETGDYIEARLSCVKALECQSGDFSPRYYQFQSLFYSNCFVEARAVLTDIMAQGEIFKTYFQNLHDSLKSLEKEWQRMENFLGLKNHSGLQDSLVNCLKIIHSSPLLENKKFEAELCLKLAAICRGDNNEDALKWIQKTVDLDNKCTKAFILKGDIEAEDENFLKAFESYKIAFVMDNFDPGVKNKLSLCSILNQHPNYYQVLGIKSSASSRVIRSAYKACALKYHPDKHAGSSKDELEKLTQDFKNIKESYNILSDPEKKENYDDGRNSFKKNFNCWNVWGFLANV